jgi:hypothetical protein
MTDDLASWMNAISGARRRRSYQALSLAQGAFFVTTGLWPILHMRSFEAVTGPKTDKWLVKTLGGLIAAVGGAIVVGGSERTRMLPLLGAGAAAALGAADVVYVAKKRISPVYLFDAVVEAGLVGAWLLATCRAAR